MIRAFPLTLLLLIAGVAPLNGRSTGDQAVPAASPPGVQALLDSGLYQRAEELARGRFEELAASPARTPWTLRWLQTC